MCTESASGEMEGVDFSLLRKSPGPTAGGGLERGKHAGEEREKKRERERKRKRKRERASKPREGLPAALGGAPLPLGPEVPGCGLRGPLYARSGCGAWD